MPQPNVSPEMFFNQVVPYQLQWYTDKKDKHTYVFRLFGEHKGEWTVDMGRREVRQGGVNKPDLYLEMDDQDFSAMIIDELDVKKAILGGRIRFAGDARLLLKFSKMLAAKPAKSSRKKPS